MIHRIEKVKKGENTIQKKAKKGWGRLKQKKEMEEKKKQQQNREKNGERKGKR